MESIHYSTKNTGTSRKGRFLKLQLSRQTLVMKHVFLLLCVVGSLATAHGAIRRVNNRPGTGAAFTDIASAITAAVTVADTIIVEGSPTAYTGFNLNKQLVILGPGYFLTDNDSTQAYTQPATINSSSTISTAGSTVSGLVFSYNTSGSTTAMLQINVNNVTVSRNYFYDTWTSTGNSNCIQVASGITGVTIAQNFIRCEQTNVSGWGLIYIPGTGNTNLVVTNNILVAGSANTTETTHRNAIWVTNSTNQGGILFANNLILGNVQSYNCTFVNNIWGRGGFINTPVGNVGRNNVLSGTQFTGQVVFTDPTAVNLNSQAMAATMFTQTGGNGAIDKFWRLAGGSSALTAGMNSSEAGPFGGPARYRLSGLPAIPVVWFGTVPTSGNTSSTLSVTFRARTIN
jgi:hypothetical protein